MHLTPNGKGVANPGRYATPQIDNQFTFHSEHENDTGPEPFSGGLRKQLAQHGFTLHAAGGPELMLTGAAVGVLPDIRSGWALLRQLRRIA